MTDSCCAGGSLPSCYIAEVQADDRVPAADLVHHLAIPANSPTPMWLSCTSGGPRQVDIPRSSCPHPPANAAQLTIPHLLSAAQAVTTRVYAAASRKVKFAHHHKVLVIAKATVHYQKVIPCQRSVPSKCSGFLSFLASALVSYLS